MKQEMSKCDEMNEQMCLFFFTRSHRSLMCCLTMMFPASNLMCPDLEISTRGQSRSDRFYHFTYKSSLLWSRMQHFQNPASLFFFPIQAAVFAAPQLLTGAVKSVCRIFMEDLPILERCGKVPLNRAFTEPHRFDAATDLKVSQGIFSLHLLRPQGQPGFFYLILAMIRDLTVFAYLKEE